MYCRKERASYDTVLLIDEIGNYKGEVYFRDFECAIVSEELLIEDDYAYFKLDKRAVELAVEHLKSNKKYENS